MKVLQVTTHIGDESGGPAYSVPALCSALQRNGCDVVLYTLKDLPDRKFDFEIKAFPISSYPIAALGRSPQLFKTLMNDAMKFDLIHSHALWMAPNYYSGLVAEKLNIPYVCSPRGSLSAWALNRSAWKKKAVMFLGQKKALDTVRCFHATSEQEKNDIANFGYANTPCKVIPNGVDIPELPNIINKKKYKQVLFLSRIHPVKGLEELILAWSKLHIDFDEWELVIAGPDKNNLYADKMKKLANELNIKRLKFIGEVRGDEKIELLFKANIFILPSYSENFAMAIAEALSCALPVICTKGTPWKDLEDQKAGWWIDLGVESLIYTLSNAMNQPEEVLMQMGNNGREWMKEKFSWDSIAKEMIKTYQWLLEKDNKLV